MRALLNNLRIRWVPCRNLCSPRLFEDLPSELGDDIPSWSATIPDSWILNFNFFGSMCYMRSSQHVIDYRIARCIRRFLTRQESY
ncbi:hypothetical protein NPIL_7771 [Nephila pilipes]|uniref:Uncharacterized protein n=1 Tax=Nephila pilipes TaxID=299642 RepID=A0A8X6UFP1_NEPPI|nr:hypothetical protein NPIL_519101 [Nephila pilipes]GFU40601.1 hypothetical protein NPIL_7771 [Nephila pilipes]